MISILLLENRNGAFTICGVDAFPGLVEKDVVAIADCWKLLNDFAGPGINDNQARGDTRHYEQPVIRLVERHRIVTQRQSHPPARRDRMRFAFYDGDFSRSGQVHIDARAAFFRLERCRVRSQLRFRDLLPVGVEFSKRSAAESDINPLARGIVAQVIGVVAVLDGFEELQRRSVEYLYRTVFATGNEQPILVWDV